jgi:hypothetical protein
MRENNGWLFNYGCNTELKRQKGGNTPAFLSYEKENLLFFLATSGFFGCLERVDFCFFGFYFDLDMGSEIADTGQPFLGGSGVSAADLAD